MKEAQRKDTSHPKKEASSLNIPLKGILYRATVSGTVAKVQCTQQFQNDGQKSIEAIYVFPLPDEASVVSCSMRIGKYKTVEAELKEKEQARKEYDKAVEKGHYASLLEQKRPNIFTMNVGGIEPAEKVEVKIVYLQPVPWQADGGRFRIPLVVAPRFIPGKPVGKTGDGWAPDTDEVPDASQITPVVAKEGVPYRAEIEVKLVPGFSAQLSCPSHPDIIPEQKITKRGITIETGKILPDRDFILSYHSISPVPEISVHKGTFQKENFVFLNIIPPFQAKPQAIDVVLLLDHSGSMSGPKIEGLKVIAQKVLKKLQEQNFGHRAGVIIFEDVYVTLTAMGEITEEIIQKIAAIESAGGTVLGPALTEAFKMFQAADTARPKYILLITDGQTESLRHIGTGVRIIACGVDTAINDTALRDLARQTGGTNEWFFPGEDFDAIVSKLIGDLSGPVLTDIKVEAGKEVVALGIRDVFQAKPAIILLQNGKIKKAHVSGKDAEGKLQEWEIDLEDAEQCNFCHQLWARESIRENQDKSQQIQTSLKYSVLCGYTSFVAIQEKKVPGKKPERVAVPVMLPYTWDYEKVFGADFAHVDFAALSATVSKGITARRRMFSGIEEIEELKPCYFDEMVETKEGMFSSDDEFNEASSLLAGLDEEPPPPTSSQFNPVDDDFIAALIALDKSNRQEAEKRWQEILTLTPKGIKSWDEERRTRSYYFALRLRPYGFKLPVKLLEALAQNPKKDTARIWYILALGETGEMETMQISYQFPADPGETAYIKWKLGTGERPQSPPWSEVP